MHRKALPLVLAAGLVLVAFAGEAKDLPPLKSISVKFPDNVQNFPPGPGSDVADNNCRSCHSTEMVLYQPDMTHAGWEAEVNKMRNVYKAPVDPKDVGPITDYLTQLKGAK
jgi:cytochrome c5